ncbi:MAG: hypothetical protein AB1810_06185 [Pseudomonadota bacterium]
MHRGWYDRKTKQVRDFSCGDTRVYLEVEVRGVHCTQRAGVKSERLDWMIHRRLYIRRFSHYVGERCHDAPISLVAKELNLDWRTVKELEKKYMRAVLAKTGLPAPEAIGIA